MLVIIYKIGQVVVKHPFAISHRSVEQSPIRTEEKENRIAPHVILETDIPF